MLSLIGCNRVVVSGTTCMMQAVKIDYVKRARTVFSLLIGSDNWVRCKALRPKKSLLPKAEAASLLLELVTLAFFLLKWS